MNGKDLADAIGLIDDRYLEECSNLLPDKKIKLHKKMSWGRIAAMVAVLPLIAVLLFVFSVPVLAASGNRTAYDVLYVVSPSSAQVLKPVRQKSEDQGIQMEVVSCNVTENEMSAYISIRDVSEDRIDETTSLYDSYGIRFAGSSYSSSCRRISYDADRREMTFLVKLWWDDSVSVPIGDKVTFFVNELRTNQEEMTEYEIKIPEEALISEAKSKTVIWTGAGGNSAASSEDTRTVEVLDIDGTLSTPLDGVRIIGAGVIAGKVHLQIAYDDPLKTGGHARFPAEMYECSYYWFNDDQTVMYQEYILTEQVLSDGARLKADFWSYDTAIKGRWEVTFRIPEPAQHTNTEAVMDEKPYDTEQPFVFSCFPSGHAGGGISRGYNAVKHQGIDIWGLPGIDILAVADGKVAETGYQEDGWGYYVILDHGNGYYTVYAHCESILVQQNETVNAGESIATMGDTGNATGTHLHFELHDKTGTAIDPAQLLSEVDPYH